MPAAIGQDLVALLPRLRRFALVLCRSPSLADDLVQGACERALANAGSFTPGTRFDAWAFRILRNHWIDHLRRSRTEGMSEDVTVQTHIVGDAGEEPKVACPLHKKTFSLETGVSLQGEEYRIQTFPVKVEGGRVYVELPAPDALDPVMATEIGCKLASHCNGHAAGRETGVVACSTVGI